MGSFQHCPEPEVLAVGDEVRVLFGRDEALSHVVFPQVREVRDARHSRRPRLVGEPVHALQARQLSIDHGIAGILLAAAVDVALELPGVELRCWHRAQERLEMQAPTRLYIGQRTMSIDAVTDLCFYIQWGQ